MRDPFIYINIYMCRHQETVTRLLKDFPGAGMITEQHCDAPSARCPDPLAGRTKPLCTSRWERHPSPSSWSLCWWALGQRRRFSRTGTQQAEGVSWRASARAMSETLMCKHKACMCDGAVSAQAIAIGCSGSESSKRTILDTFLCDRG